MSETKYNWRADARKLETAVTARSGAAFNNHIVMFSSGLGSWAAAKRVVEKYGADRTKLLFCDTLVEDADNYRFLDEAAQNVGAELVRIADGRTPFEVFRDVRVMGNSRVDPCSRILKRDLADSWLAQHYTPENAVVYVGIDWTEEHRFTRLAERKLPWVYSAPMLEPPYLGKRDVVDWARREGLEPPRMYAMGFPHANCGGFCIKAGQAQARLLHEKNPAYYRFCEDEEEKTYAAIGKRHPFLRVTRDGILRYVSLREFRQEFIEAQQQIDLFDWGGCGCFSDDELAVQP